MNPLVSVVICTYNQGEYLRDAVESVLGQTYPHWELIVVDNGSTDGSAALLREYEGDARVRLLLYPENGPVTRRLNEAIRLSRGPYLSLLWGDDYYLPHKLERQVAAFAEQPAEVGVVYGPGFRENVRNGERWLDPTVRRSGWILEEILLKERDNVINPIAPLIRRECFERYPFHEDLFGEWEAIFARFAIRYAFHYLDEPLVVMRDHDHNAGKAMRHNVDRAMLLLDRLLLESGFPPQYREAVEVCRARILRVGGWRVLREGGDPVWSRRCLLRAIRSNPREVLGKKVILGVLLSLFPHPLRLAINDGTHGPRHKKLKVHCVERSDIAVRDFELAAGAH